MYRIFSSRFFSTTHSMLVLAAALATASCQGSEPINTVEEVPAKEAAAPALKAAAAPAPNAHDEPACAGRGAENCHCNPTGGGDEAAIGDVEEDVTVGDALARGPANAPVTLVVFSDFECPFCARLNKTLHTLEQEYPGELRIAFKHHPLPIHKHADNAARAFSAANAQGKAWELADALFNAKGEHDASWIERSAVAAGLSIETLRRDMRAADVEAKVAADEAQAVRLKIQGTPTVFLNGRRIKGAQPIEVFREAIDRILASR